MSLKWCIIGSGNYDDSNIKDLEGAIHSIERLHSVVVTELGILSEDVLYLVDKEVGEINKEILQFWKEINEKDTIVFYFCGHGVKANNELYLYAKDTQQDYVQMTAINYRNVINSLRYHKVRRIIAILDCCNSGAAVSMGNENEEGISNQVVVDGEVILCSCSEIETSIQREINGKYYSVFTYTFAEILSKGSSLEKEFISISDVFSLLKKEYEKRSGRTLVIEKKQELDQIDLFKNMDYVKKEKAEKRQELDEVRSKFSKRKEWKILLVKCAIKYPTRGIDFGVPLGLWVLRNYIMLSMPNVIVDIYDERLYEMKKVEKRFEEEIETYDVIGISMCTCEVPRALEKFKIAHNNGKITVAGGIFTYSNEKYLLDEGTVDYVIPGVGTVPWVKLIKALVSNKSRTKEYVNVNNVYSRTHMDTVTWIPDIMPGMEYHEWETILKHYGKFINKKIYEYGKEIKVPKIDIVTSRGCNKNCSFCSVRIETGSSVIKRDKTVIKEEIDYLYSQGIRYFSIKDEDLFIHGTSRVADIMNHCKKYSDIRFKVRMRLDTWKKYPNDISVTKLKAWGIDEIQYGVESPQNDILMMLQKGITIEKNEIIDLFKEHYKNGIKVNASFILGCSELEDKTYYKQLEQFIENIYDPTFLVPYINFFTPHPVYSSLVKDKYMITTKDFNYYTHKIPVAYPTNMKSPQRNAMISAYNQIRKTTKSELYNPAIPEEARKLFSMGKSVFGQKNEIRRN